MPTYEAFLLCDDGHECCITTTVDENDPLFMQDIILVAIEQGHKPVEVMSVEYIGENS